MIWIILSVVVYIVSCEWYWYEIHIYDSFSELNYKAVICTFIPIVNLTIAVLFLIDRVDWKEFPNKFFRK